MQGHAFINEDPRFHDNKLYGFDYLPLYGGPTTRVRVYVGLCLASVASPTKLFRVTMTIVVNAWPISFSILLRAPSL
jgi:hypothetical protein